jgi:hypothetical protein
MTLSEMQNKRSKASHIGNDIEYWLYDALICQHLGLPYLATQSLEHAVKATQKENAK